MRPLISRPTALRSRHSWEVATALLLMRNKVTAKGHVGVRKTQRWEKKKTVLVLEKLGGKPRCRSVS